MFSLNRSFVPSIFRSFMFSSVGPFVRSGSCPIVCLFVLVFDSLMLSFNRMMCWLVSSLDRGFVRSRFPSFRGLRPVVFWFDRFFSFVLALDRYYARSSFRSVAFRSSVRAFVRLLVRSCLRVDRVLFARVSVRSRFRSFVSSFHRVFVHSCLRSFVFSFDRTPVRSCFRPYGSILDRTLI